MLGEYASREAQKWGFISPITLWLAGARPFSSAGLLHTTRANPFSTDRTLTDALRFGESEAG